MLGFLLLGLAAVVLVSRVVAPRLQRRAGRDVRELQSAVEKTYARPSLLSRMIIQRFRKR